MKQLLLVDDNDKYAAILGDYFSKLGYNIERAVSAADGYDRLTAKPAGYFSVIVTDITMESQLAGVSMLGRIKKLGFQGTIVVASTGFDVFLGLPLSRVILSNYGVHYLIPKKSVLKKDLNFFPVDLFSEPSKTFVEVSL